MSPKSKKLSFKFWIGTISASIVLSACLITALRVHAQIDSNYSAEVAAATSYAEFQYATVTGSNNIITATRLPIVLSSGAVVYKNLTINVSVDPQGNVTVPTGGITAVVSPATQILGFKAGSYGGPSTTYAGKALITVSGPGVTTNGSTEWSLSTATGANNCTYPSSATWYVGTLASNPSLAARLKAAGITSTAYSYGIVGNGPGCFPGNWWYNGSIIGLSQTGSAITIVSFTSNGSVDHATAGDQITYTLKP